MKVEPVTGSGKSISLFTQTRLAADKEVGQKDDDVKKAVRELSLAELSETASNVQKNINIIHNIVSISLFF